MDIRIIPGKLQGSVTAIPSKSQAHRLLICAAFADAPTTLVCPETNRDIEATAACLRSLGVTITQTEQGYQVLPTPSVPKHATLPCCDSGSTLRFLLPVVGALGVEATFLLEGRLGQRPLSPLWEEMERMGCLLTRPNEQSIRCCGKLRPGAYSIDGGVSSQFITGLMLALPLLEGNSTLTITGKIESKPYIDLTREALSLFGVSQSGSDIQGNALYHSSGTVTVEGDWSNGAFFLAAKALGSDLTVTNLSPTSCQGDRAAQALLPQLRHHSTICAADIPDLVPILSVVAACHQGAVFTDIGRLRLKESDRVASVIAMLEALGGQAQATDNTLRVFGTGLFGGTVDCANDHRIAMSAAIASTCCREPVILLGAQCVAKSYPLFWEEFRRLGGKYEQYLR